MTRALPHALVLGLLLALLTMGGCSLFGGKKPAPAQAEPAAADAKGGPEKPPPGMLDTIAQTAPPGSPTQLLARLAAEFGWEEQVAANPVLKEAVGKKEFKDRVEPFLLGLYYKNGFSVLPVVGEGHQFNRDTIVQGALGSSRLLVTTRKRVRIIFLRPVQNVEIVYHQDGEEPQVFSVSDQSVVAVRQSLTQYYLR